MQAALIVLLLAAIGGVTLAAIRLRGAPWPPLWLAVGHGVVAATGVGILIYFALTAELPELAIASLVVFVLAALGGATLFFGFHLRSKPLPIPFVLGHGLIAIVGYVLLLIAYFQG